MSVLVYIEADNNAVKKSSLEALTYAAKMNAGDVTALVTDKAENLEELGKYGVKTVLQVTDEQLSSRPVSAIASTIAGAAQKAGANIVVMSRSSTVDAVAPRVGVKMSATVASNVVALPQTDNGFVVRRGVFTGKAFADTKLEGENKVLTIAKNALAVDDSAGGSATVEAFSPEYGAKDFAIKVTDVKKQEGDILLPEADLVVSAGRGLKGPENWGMIEELATTLGAATACSKPVSDMDWRPHHEHVGQTGIKVAPSLYIATGISGAIQHLAGVNSSKTIVVINKDAEAPFFKSADYGVVGDAFDVIPKLTEALKKAGV
ncbi:electron transfer flavoprotein, alpha subunit [Bernardetia litoralis DSM 6794]|uniref:Electron transfer flavoprotein, alpha subunit n=1 Tax=Bernardetia litoralis (strain ATCC 23117 / DSM 6794 / NBRC 15988 / NCIMB 1366 / Fx l1 / Sio-4) TaxID=880071 RepID=I4AQB3_BERLS|nr:electron transfer flavoprotein subunit alpha/FixB family protein [Bernardetia litoralis]AFM06148.1 electron transfer flavoprotein, alpha subunit [Bernardetia litoralis DSM 6794]